jgi:hypothetical protein
MTLIRPCVRARPIDTRPHRSYTSVARRRSDASHTLSRPTILGLLYVLSETSCENGGRRGTAKRNIHRRSRSFRSISRCAMPRLGSNNTCRTVIAATDNGATVSLTNQGPYDGSGDPLVGLVDNGKQSLFALGLRSPLPSSASMVRHHPIRQRRKFTRQHWVWRPKCILYESHGNRNLGDREFHHSDCPARRDRLLLFGGFPKYRPTLFFDNQRLRCTASTGQKAQMAARR